MASGDVAQATIRLQAVAPVLSVTPASHDFGEVDVGAYADRSFEVTNAGQGTLDGTAATSPPFSIVSGGSYSLAAGESQSVAVRFSPGAPGDYDNSVSFTGGSGATRPVTGHTPPVLEVSPASRNVPVGGGEVTFTVNNAGGGQMDWTAEVISGAGWLEVTSGVGGTNAGEVVLACQANATGSARTGTVRIGAPGASPESVEAEVVQSASSSPMDIDGDGRINAVDVQLVINRALGLSVPQNCDVDGDGKVNAVDVQLVINGALGLA